MNAFQLSLVYVIHIYLMIDCNQIRVFHFLIIFQIMPIHMHVNQIPFFRANLTILLFDRLES
jgi:hypothetical protein